MEWYKVYVYDQNGTCLTTERHMSEDHAAESVAGWMEDGSLTAYYCPQD